MKAIQNDEVASNATSPGRRGLNNVLASDQYLHRKKVIGNSHSNARLPTEKEQSLMVELGRLSRLNEDGGGKALAERSLDRVKIGQMSSVPFVSRQELLANEYKKVIANHPGTLIQQKGDFYDDTDLLQEMFAKEKANILQSRDLRTYESIDSLHKSDSAKNLLAKKKNKRRSESVEVEKLPHRLRTDEVKTSKFADKLHANGDSSTRLDNMKPTSHFSLLGPNK